ncbi:hypothetical protein [Paenibacillus algorifonticola]|uniref:hypothetical protein n=1 Tax=Paenibacillus algorifonticola TaxID=684063 RepID=UPI00061923CB|nr:hypothetical protein [Paenibacillus algorifonticola]
MDLFFVMFAFSMLNIMIILILSLSIHLSIIKIGYNGRREGQHNPSIKEMHDDLQNLINKNRAKNDPDNIYLDNSSYETWDVDNCAEIQAVNQELHAGVKIENIIIRTVHGSDGTLIDLCNNCSKIFENF